MPIVSPVARRYASALIGAAGDRIDRAAQDLDRFTAAFEDSFDLRNVLSNPIFTQTERKKALEATGTKLEISEIVRRFLEILGDKGRMGDLPAIARTVRRLADERAGRLRARVETATPLAPDAVDNLRRALEKRTGKKIELDISVDPSLLGGVRARIGSQVFDGTIRSQLDQLQESLARSEQ